MKPKILKQPEERRGGIPEDHADQSGLQGNPGPLSPIPLRIKTDADANLLSDHLSSVKKASSESGVK